MKKHINLILFGLMPLFVISQIPHSFNYQAAVRNSDGEIQYNTPANFKIEILQNGNSIFSENHLGKNTGKIGVVNFKVGMGTEKIGDFSQIDWSEGLLQIRVHLTLPGGQEEEMGSADIVAVPFALYAQNANDDGDWVKDDFANTLYFQGENNEGRVAIGKNSASGVFDVYGQSNFFRRPNSSRLLNLGNVINNGGDIWISSFNGTEPLWRLNMFDQNEGGRFSIRSEIADRDLLWTNHNGTLFFNGQTTILRPPNLSSVFNLNSQGLGDLWITSWKGAGNKIWRINMLDVSQNDRFAIRTETPSGPYNDVFWIEHNGMTNVRTLQIHGGSDIKEDINSIESLEPGDLVVIDEKNPGQIRRTNAEYDRKVAGIISGANGINPGISLSQEEVLEGDFPLTMLGRVYVKVTGIVEIGDMLTTSSKPGYAMSVQDYSKANGTVVGKAMTKNENGEGKVLVLVNLQ